MKGEKKSFMKEQPPELFNTQKPGLKLESSWLEKD